MKVISGKYEKALEYCEKEFEGNYFQFYFPFVDEQSRFIEIERFLYESRHSLRFANHYEGNVVIDISEWNRKNKVNRYFFAFLCFIKDNTDIYNCIFIMDKNCEKKIAESLREYLDFNLVILDGLKSKEKVKIGFDFTTSQQEDNNVRS